MNPLRHFKGNSSGLSSLSVLDVTGIVDWKPEKKLLQLRMLERIIGLTWSAECQNCLFYRSNRTNSNLKETISWKSEKCYKYKYRTTDLSPIGKLLSNTSFQFECASISTCHLYRTTTELNETVNKCWKETLAGITVQSLFGYVGVLVNLLVIFNILFSKTLRQNVSMFFVCNMAVSDFLLSVYTICITTYLNSVSFTYSNENSYRHCWKMGFLWMLGEAGSVITTFLLTLERYLVIVYSLNPDIRISRKMAAVLILVCWLVAIVLTGYALYYNFYRFTFLCIPVRFDIDIFDALIFTIVIVVFALFFYLLTFVFYAHIYVTVKRAAQNAGVNRESKLAKRVALLVFSNIFFFCVPIIVSAFITVLYQQRILKDLSDVVFEVTAKVLPAIFLSLNSFLNPFLHAFRNDRFTQALKVQFQCLRNIRVLFERQQNFRVYPETRMRNVKVSKP
ncbi:lutropin-choriogonadotropic hormone receptor-like [Actinia tenebrosa]|uniref:Lutropin-choriogonadotropic hormone receptor-like n=1 Tax=Actinia tenebrosa TaxID=6105 RepID=A0A6P8HUP1_ACTTE|nr:lutropin-choriogonadotropic hormone receptor-like [Actinia tenebrosa]